jgi:hypothetical protein
VPNLGSVLASRLTAGNPWGTGPSTTGFRPSAHTPRASEILQKIGGGRNAFFGFGHSESNAPIPDRRSEYLPNAFRTAIIKINPTESANSTEIGLDVHMSGENHRTRIEVATGVRRRVNRV